MSNWSKILDDILDGAFLKKDKVVSTTKAPEISKYNGEKVLVFKTSIIAPEDSFQGMISGDQAKSFREKYLIPENLFYIDRDIAENDPSYKQVIPYCCITRANELFYYERSKKGSEERLHNLFSLGVGGHINPCDGNDNETISAACKRELDEEVEYTHFNGGFFAGLINDDSNPVNSVHFGVVFHIQLKSKGIVKPKETKLISADFSPVSLLAASNKNWENWSVFLLRGYIRNIF